VSHFEDRLRGLGHIPWWDCRMGEIKRLSKSFKTSSLSIFIFIRPQLSSKSWSTMKSHIK
jgi:hypothetical protein